jgi:glutathione S-transferase
MKLYTAPFAPNPRRVTMFIAEKGITDIEHVQLDLVNGEHRSAEFRAKSPLAQVPALELDDGRTLTESRAICSYLETLYPEPNLMGVDAYERAHIEMWDRRAELQFSLQLMLWVRHGSPALAMVEKNQSADLSAYSQANAMRMAKWLNNELSSRAWIAGERFTIADITAACGVDFAKMMRWHPGDDLPHLRRWRDAIGERAAGKVAA